MPWSIPVAATGGLVAGIAASEMAGHMARKSGASERTERIIRLAANSTVSGAVHAGISTLMADPVGLAAAPATALGGAALQQFIFEQFINGHAPPLPPAL